RTNRRERSGDAVCASIDRPSPQDKDKDKAIRTTPPRERSVLSSVLKLWNESRTNRARIADSILSEFVHGDIWWHGLCIPQNRVRGPQSRSRPMLKSINGDARRRNSQDWRGRNGLVPDPIIAFLPWPCSVAAWKRTASPA